MWGRMSKNISEIANIDGARTRIGIHLHVRALRGVAILPMVRRPQCADSRLMTTTAHLPSVFDAALPYLDHYAASCPDEGHRAIAEARAIACIALGPYGPEMLSYELVRTVLRDSRFAMPAGNGLSAQGITSGPLWRRVCESIVGIDGAEHLRLRRLVSRAFTPRTAERMRTACTDVITELVDRITELVDRHGAAGHCDVVGDIARHYPIPIICALLGVPRSDWHLFSDWVKRIGKAFGANVAGNESAILLAWDNLDAYLDELIDRRRRSLSDDLLSGLIVAEDDGQRLTHNELRNLVGILLVAGTDTTRNQLAAAVDVLCDHPAQWNLLGERPDLAARTVEEIMRHTPVSMSAIRIAVGDVELGGVVIPAGTFVVANTAAANRDPAAYDQPDRFDLTREGPRPMLTFGGGAHNCLGAHLARVELAEALVVMARRMPGLRRAGPALRRPMIGITGPTAVPVEFDTR
jgi:cytochrome P450